MLFFSDLSLDQKKSFMALATRMLLADGRVAPEEDRLIAAMRREAGPEAARAPAGEVFGPINAEAFGDRRSQVTATIGFLLMGLIDNHFHVDESEVFQQLVTAFGFTDDQVARMHDIAEREAKILAEIDTLAGV